MLNFSWALRGVATSLLLLAAAAQTRADQVAWSYQWSSSPQLISSSSNQAFLVLPYSGTNAITTGSQNLSAPVLGISSSSATSSSPDTITQTPYSLTLTLHDQATGQNLPVTFQGELGGSLWNGGAFLNNVLTSATTQTVTAGNDVYHVTFDSFGAPQANGTTSMTYFSFHVDAQQAPEPSALVLGILGMPFFLTVRRRRRRTAAV